MQTKPLSEYHEELFIGGQFIAIVTSAKKGKANHIQTVDGIKKVYGHSRSVEYLYIGDEILFTLTECGPIITHIIARANDPIPLFWQIISDKQAVCEFGETNLICQRNGTIKIKNQKSNFQFSSDGDIQIQGNTFYQKATSSMKMVAQAIYLN